MLPTTPGARKALPLFTGLVRYFPDALAEVAAVSKAGSEQHHPGQPVHWDRSKSGDELDALTRHLFEAGTIDTDGCRHSAKLAWRALANLQKELEAAREKAGVTCCRCETPMVAENTSSGQRWRCPECNWAR